MSDTAGYTSADLLVEDDENAIDQRVKKRIINRREDVDEWAMELFTQEKLGDIDHRTAVSIWGDRVRTYLMAVEPLMWNSGLERAEQVYLHEELGIVSVEPPQEWVEAAAERRREGGDIEILGGDSLKPKKRVISGIKDVIELETVGAEWSIQIRDRTAAGDGRRREETITEVVPINKRTLQNAVRVADEWLQRNGIGVKIEAQDYIAGEGEAV